MGDFIGSIQYANVSKRVFNLQYKITNMTLGGRGIVRWYLTENFENNPTFINFTDISFANVWNTTAQIMGFYFANGTEVVLINK